MSTAGPLVTVGSTPPPPSVLGFSQPLDGLLPATPLQVCSTPQARPGFSLQGVSLVKSRRGSSPWPCPLVVHREAPLLAERPSSQPHFRALLPSRVRNVRRAVKRAGRPIPSWAFPSPGLASLRPSVALPRPSPHELPFLPYGTGGNVLPRVFPGRSDGPSLARRTFPLEVPGLVDSLARSARAPDRAHWFTSGGLATSPPRSISLFGPSSPPTAAARVVRVRPYLF